MLNLVSASIAVFVCDRSMIAAATSPSRSAQICSSKKCQGRLPTSRIIRRVSVISTNAIPSIPCKPWKQYTAKTSAHHLWSRRYLALLDLATSLLLQNRLTPRHTRCRLHKSQSRSSPQQHPQLTSKPAPSSRSPAHKATRNTPRYSSARGTLRSSSQSIRRGRSWVRIR